MRGTNYGNSEKAKQKREGERRKADITLTPPGTQYGTTRGKSWKKKQLT